jgi:hypothetical protein
VLLPYTKSSSFKLKDPFKKFILLLKDPFKKFIPQLKDPFSNHMQTFHHLKYKIVQDLPWGFSYATPNNQPYTVNLPPYQIRQGPPE